MGTRARDAVSLADRLLFGVGLLAVGTLLFHFMYAPSQPAFRNYGVVQTSIGMAAVACGGETSGGCGVETALRFVSCSPRFHDYFDNAPATDDELVRRLVGKAPLSGDRWIVQCGGADAMIESRPLAELEAN
jgi:hypothetical protein